MAKNRKSQSAELRFGPALKALLICFFIGGAGIGYVYQKNLLRKLGDEKETREKNLERLKFSNQAQDAHLWQLNTQRILERRVEELGLKLRPPSPSQIVVIVDEPPHAVAPIRKSENREASPHLARGGESQGP